MLKLCLIVSLCAVTFTKSEFIFKPGPLFPPTKGEIWPKVQEIDKLDDGFYSVLTTCFYFNNVGKSCKTLEEALDRYRQLIVFNSRKIKEIYFKVRTCYENDRNFLGFLWSLDVELTESCNDDEYPQFDMKEEYNLTITNNLRKLTSNTLWGILRGLESFSQLIYLTDDYSCHRIETVQIHDFPRFAHRGLLLDTSRHYQTKEQILKYLDAMSYNKYNVFHWHITDDYSFPYVSTTFPEMSEQGAFHPTLMVYEQSFVEEVQEYAKKRGIRVLMEFDTPGHTLSWGVARPELLTDCVDVPMLRHGPFDPTKTSTYEFMYRMLDEIKSVFKDHYTHLGGDEVDYSCWKSNHNITDYMKANGIENDYVALQSQYTQKIIRYASHKSLKSIVWEEVFTNGVELPPGTVVEVWKHEKAAEVLEQVTAAGFPAIISSYWYLDYLANGGDWLKFYNQDPHDFNGTDEQKMLVLGGEACMWAEVVNENNLEPRVWPRASVPAEKFWSAPDSRKSLMNIDEVLPLAARLEEHTCRMSRRGIRAQPSSGPSVCF